MSLLSRIISMFFVDNRNQISYLNLRRLWSFENTNECTNSMDMRTEQIQTWMFLVYCTSTVSQKGTVLRAVWVCASRGVRLRGACRRLPLRPRRHAGGDVRRGERWGGDSSCVWTVSNRRDAATLQNLGVFWLDNCVGSSERISDILQMTLRNA
jgi:hypothetical protein